MVSNPFRTPSLSESRITGDTQIAFISQGIIAIEMPKAALDPVLAIARVQNKNGIGILFRQIREKLVPFEKVDAIQPFHVGEYVEFAIAGDNIVAIGEIREHSPRETAVVPMHAANAIGDKITVYRRRAAAIEADLKNFHRSFPRNACRHGIVF